MNDVETALGPGLKITCSREELAKKVALVSRGVSTRTAVQILGGYGYQPILLSMERCVATACAGGRLR